MQILRRAGYRQMAWKNGQGRTEEVATFPQDSSVEDFDWRISIAHVETDGLFSIFPGIDRTIALLDGKGLVLDLPDDRVQALRPAGDPFAFPGEWVISSRNCEGPTIDLNIMTRRGRMTHQLAHQMSQQGQVICPVATSVIMFNTPALLRYDDTEHSVDRFDAMMLEAGEAIHIASESAELLVATLSPA